LQCWAGEDGSQFSEMTRADQEIIYSGTTVFAFYINFAPMHIPAGRKDDEAQKKAKNERYVWRKG